MRNVLAGIGAVVVAVAIAVLAIGDISSHDTPLEADLQAWVNDLQDGAPYQQIEADADKVGADCGAVGIKLFPVPSS